MFCRSALTQIIRKPHLFLRMGSRSNFNSNRSSSSGDSPVESGKHVINTLMDEGFCPREVLSKFAPSVRVSPNADDMALWRLLYTLIEPPRRKKLTRFNTIEDAVNLIRDAKKIVVLSGAGISTSAGLPDFRSRNGIYVQIHAEHPDLDDPKCMFDIEYFRKNPLPFYQFAKALFPGQFKPTIGHEFIKCIEEKNKLLRNYSQNIDTLEKQAGITRVVECHGSFAKASCTNCKYSVDGDVIREDIMNKKVPLCPKCHPKDHSSSHHPADGLGVMKPNIVFFGENLGSDFHTLFETDKDEADLLIVIGSSLKVRPVALIPKRIPPEVPQILINKEPLEHMEFDIELLGNCNDIIQELCLRLGDDWTKICEPGTRRLKEVIEIKTVETHSNSDTSIEDEIAQRSSQAELEGDTQSKSTSNIAGEQNAVASSDEALDDACSFRSNQVNVPSEGTEQNAVEELQETKDDDDCAIDSSSTEEWEDIEVLDSSNSSQTSILQSRARLDIPEGSYIFASPNTYIFKGAEITNSQLKSLARDRA